MLNEIFNSILTNTTGDITPQLAVLTIIAAAVLGGIIAATYKLTQDDNTYESGFAVTLLMLPVILSVIIIFIGSNIARAFSLAGTLSIIRFRSAPGDPKDIGFVFFAIAAGLACGVGLYAYGLLFVTVLCLAIIIIEKTHVFEKKGVHKQLRISVPEDLNTDDAFEDTISKYTIKHSLTKVKTTDLGSLFELCYDIYTDRNINRIEFLNELRVRNGNLTVAISDAPKKEK